MGADEPRYARIAEEMYQEGRWITPILEGYPWLEKPPLYYWITIPFVALLGAGEVSARLGSALFALLASMTVFWLGAKLWTQLAGFLGAAILITSIGFCAFARSASTDMPMTACLTVALAILAVAAVRDNLSIWKVLPAYVFLGLAILAKGPVALLLAIGITFLYWCLDDRGGSYRRWHAIAGMLVTVAVVLPWFGLAFLQNGYSFILMFFVNQNLARYVSEIHHHPQPFFYFIPVLIGLIFPWTGWLPVLFPSGVVGLIRRWRQWNPAVLFLICWIAFPLLFFSLSQSKLAGYILPTIPPLALLLGSRLARCLEGDPNGGVRAAPWLHLFLSVGVAVAIPLVFQEIYGESWRLSIPLSLIPLAPAFIVLWASRRENWSAAVRATIFQGVILVLAVTQFGFPILARSLSTREISHLALEIHARGNPIVTYRLFNHTLFYYTEYKIESQLRDRDGLLRFALTHPSFLVVTEKAYLLELRNLPGFSTIPVGEQGKYQLLQIKHH